jgi:hypothetical protein
MTDERFIDDCGIDSRAFERRARGHCAQLGRMDVPECAAVTADGCSGGANDDDVFKGHELTISIDFAAGFWGWLLAIPAPIGAQHSEIAVPAIRPTIHPFGFKNADFRDEIRVDRR